MSILSVALSGAVIMGCGTAALFFLRFWRDTADRLFAIFALAFALLGAERVILVAVSGASENRPYIYLIRLSAFVLIMLAVADKNRGGSRRRGGS